MHYGKVVFNEKQAEGIYLLGIKTDKRLVENFKPGQFLKIKLNSRLDPLIPRPFTVHAVEGDVFFILYQIKGKGTSVLAEMKPENEVEFLAPLGNPFPVLRNYVICAGGIGVAGFGYLLQQACKKNLYHMPACFFYGARTKAELVRLEFLKYFNVLIKIATDDGSTGYKGFITDLVEEELEKEPKDVLACGPLPMLKKLAKIGTKFGVRVFLVMETFLACGTGFCRGCVIPLKKGGYKHLCTDGPTLLAEELDIDAIS